MKIPDLSSRTAEEIVGENLYFDSAGYFYRAMSWLNYFDKNDKFTALLYSCIEARYGIEYLMFEELILSTGSNMTKEEYEECLKQPTKLYNVFRKISPDYERLQGFTKIIISFDENAPVLIQWNLKKLLKSWGSISNYLHWCGSKDKTTESTKWRADTATKVRSAIEPLWLNMISGNSGLMHPKDMHPEIYNLWIQYKANKLNANEIRSKVEILSETYDNNRHNK